MTRSQVIVGSRGSRLALIQTKSVVARMETLHPVIEFTIRIVVTHGDRDRRIQLDRLDVIGAFVKGLAEEVLDSQDYRQGLAFIIRGKFLASHGSEEEETGTLIVGG